MAEYIDRQAAIEIASGYCHPANIAAELAKLPAADVRPVRRGKWTLNKDGSGTCSECGFVQNSCWDLDNWDNFCHHCGADMREES